MNSEFGKGFTYCIGLFLCHQVSGREVEAYQKAGLSPYTHWIYGAADHLFELKVPKNATETIKQKTKELQEFVLKNRRKEEITKENFLWCIETAKEILFKWDLQCGIDTEKAIWS